MKKTIVTFGLLLLITGIPLTSIQESHIEEGVLKEWNPAAPLTLPPQDEFRWSLLPLTLTETFLELNISASGDVRVIIGILNYEPISEYEFWRNVIFNQTGTYFNQNVSIAEASANLLQIKNEGTECVNITGYIKKLGNIRKTVYPYSGYGTLMSISGIFLLFLGILTKPRKMRSQFTLKKSKASYRQNGK